MRWLKNALKGGGRQYVEKETNIDFTIRKESSTDYKLIAEFSAQAKLFKHIFHKSKMMLSKVKKMKVEGNEDVIDGFDVPQIYHKVLNVQAGKIYALISNDVHEKDKMNLLNRRVTAARFQRSSDGERWNIKLTFEGQYVEV